MVKPSSILSSLMPATSNRSQPSNSQIAMSGRQSASIASNSFATYYQTTFYSRLNSLGGVKRFNERFRIKGHLGAGAHGLILWAVDKNNINKSNELTTQFTEPSRNQNADNYDLDFIVNDLENAFESSSDDDDGDSTDTVDLNAWKGQYAVKRIFIRNRIVPVVIVREIKVLQLLRSHPNIISLLDVCPSGSSINLIFPLLPTNLTTLIYSHQLNSSQCSLYTQMLAEGVAYLHQNGIVHRDIKPSNLLIDWNGVLKLADFGQARAIDIGLEINGHRSELTYQVCTRWYRAPELLYGATNYGYDVDMWSVGCVIGEMIQEWPLFKGDSDIEQLSLVVKALGTPKGEWTEMLPDFNKIQFVHDDPEESEELANRFPRWLETIRTQARSATNRCTDQVMDLLSKLCRYTERINAQQLLQHPFLNLSSVKQNREKLLIKARYIKHLSGPKKNEP